jgi:hypothetical protein
VLSWTFLMRPQVVDTELDLLSLSISLAYPIADLILIGVAMGLLTTPGARSPAFLMLGASLGCLLFADQVYALQALEACVVAGSLLDSVTWRPPAVRRIGTRPSMRRLTDPHPVQVTWPDRSAALPGGGHVLTGPALLTMGRRRCQVGRDRGGHRAAVAPGPGSAGRPGRTLARDVSQRRALEAQLSFQAFHDR